MSDSTIDLSNRHRPLRSGVNIRTGLEVSWRVQDNPPRGETLTGLATRDWSNEKVLVTCEHVMSGLGLRLANRPSPSTARKMYQPLANSNDVGDVVGESPQYPSMSIDGDNPADIAACELIRPSDDDSGGAMAKPAIQQGGVHGFDAPTARRLGQSLIHAAY